MKAGGGVGGFNLDKTGPRCGPKGQAPIHVKVGACVHACVCVKKGGGLAWTQQRGLYESGRVSEAKKEARGAPYFKYTFTRPLGQLDTDLQHLQSLRSLQQKLENYY